jgi:hypothetical protein
MAISTAYIILFQKISQNTALVLNSNFWLSSTKETIQDVLRLDDLGVSETDLLKAILRWGIAKFPKKGRHVCTGSEIREVIDPFLKLIRFMSMECTEFAELCIAPNSLNVLSADEQRLILLSLVLKNHKYMPVNFNCSNVTRLMAQSAIICSISCNYDSYQQNVSPGRENLKFSANQSVNLLGIAIDLNVMSQQHVGYNHTLPPNLKSSLTCMKFTVLDAHGTIISEGNTSNIRNVNTKDIIVLSPPKTLRIGQQYTLECTSTIPNNSFFRIQNLNHAVLLHDSASKSQQALTNQRNMLQIQGYYFRAPITGLIVDPKLAAS